MPVRLPGNTNSRYLQGAIADWQPAGAFTMHFRVLPLESATQTLATRWQGSTDRAFLLDISGSSTAFNILGADNNGYGENSGPPVQPGVWSSVFAVFTGSGGSVEVYVNGRKGPGTAVGATTIHTSSLSPVIGARLDSGITNSNFNGFIEDIATWSVALTPAEMNHIVRGGKPWSIRRGALMGYWPLADNFAPGVDLAIAALTPVGTADLAAAGQQDTLMNTELWFVAEEEPPVVDIIAPFLSVGTGIRTPTVSESGLFAPFLNIGVGMFSVGLTDLIYAPFFNVGAGLSNPFLLAGLPPPFIPPSLPPTLLPGTPVGPGVPLPPLSSGGLGGIRFYQGPPWRWLVTDLETNTLTFLDRLAAQAVVTYGLDRGASAKLTVPSASPEVNILHTDGDPFVSEGNRLLYGFRREGDGPLWQCRFAGKILLVGDSGLTENATTTITAFDPWHMLYQRPMVNWADEFPDEAGFFSFDDTQVGVIALTFLRNTILNHGEVGIDMGDDTPAWSTTGAPDFDPVQLPGTSYWGSPYQAVWSGRTKSKYETTTQVDTDCEQGLMVGEVWDQQIDTGAVDILLTPIYDPVNRPGYLAEVSIYERAGRQADDAVFAWDKPSRNLTKIDRTYDGTKRANTIRYSYGQGGPPVQGGIPISDGASILKYGETWHTQSWPGRDEAAVLALEQLQLELLKDGILTVAIEPASERMPFLFTEWWLGDTVPEYASARLRAPLEGFQRIYGIVLNIDENGYERVPQVLVSPDTA